jgi:hypothetical protein
MSKAGGLVVAVSIFGLIGQRLQLLPKQDLFFRRDHLANRRTKHQRSILGLLQDRRLGSAHAPQQFLECSDVNGSERTGTGELFIGVLGADPALLNDQGQHLVQER